MARSHHAPIGRPSTGRLARSALALGLFAVALAAGAGCAATVQTPPPPSLDGYPLARFWRVDQVVFRSAQPTGAQLAELRDRYGIRSVIKLNGREKRDVVPPGVTLIDEPIGAMREPDPAQLARILDEVERAPKPVLIHCTQGRDRTGLVVALYLRRHGVAVADAEADMRRRGFRPYRGLRAAWRRSLP